MSIRKATSIGECASMSNTHGHTDLKRIEETAPKSKNILFLSLRLLLIEVREACPSLHSVHMGSQIFPIFLGWHEGVSLLSQALSSFSCIMRAESLSLSSTANRFLPMKSKHSKLYKRYTKYFKRDILLPCARRRPIQDGWKASLGACLARACEVR